MLDLRLFLVMRISCHNQRRRKNKKLIFYLFIFLIFPGSSFGLLTLTPRVPLEFKEKGHLGKTNGVDSIGPFLFQKIALWTKFKAGFTKEF
ncbi:hypothetical protein SLEP1_g5343 [Rubroshorea leprosula]|uniref:Uncharacterized protein n=1 Tax=Rubroshorea leprosula TaxID=152421 RepID=A0AAV5I1G7_9ROSI|nr:hypothetical protein SLEP1_g5343 [Rubroshorea leprosula]